ncbi:MAG: hypothetical protein K6A82_01890 [Prevotella sp.]|nr:hypothetical protein [Prevotella sp.]
MNTTTTLSFYDLLNYGGIGAIIYAICTMSASPIAFSTSELVPIFLIGFIYSKICEMSLGRIVRNNERMLLQADKQKKTSQVEFKYSFLYDSHLYDYVKSTIVLLEASLAFVRNLWPISIGLTLMAVTQEPDSNSTSVFDIEFLIWIISILLLISMFQTIFVAKRGHYLIYCLIILALILCPIIVLFYIDKGYITIYGHNILKADFVYFLMMMDFIIPFLWYNIQVKIFSLVFELKYIQHK